VGVRWQAALPALQAQLSEVLKDGISKDEVFKAHRLLCHSILGSRVITKKKDEVPPPSSLLLSSLELSDTQVYEP